MAASFNHITLIGRLTRDPEIRYIANGNAVTSFSIAINRKTKSGDEEDAPQQKQLLPVHVFI